MVNLIGLGKMRVHAKYSVLIFSENFRRSWNWKLTRRTGQPPVAKRISQLRIDWRRYSTNHPGIPAKKQFRKNCLTAYWCGCIWTNKSYIGKSVGPCSNGRHPDAGWLGNRSGRNPGSGWVFPRAGYPDTEAEIQLYSVLYHQINLLLVFLLQHTQGFLCGISLVKIPGSGHGFLYSWCTHPVLIPYLYKTLNLSCNGRMCTDQV